MAAKLIYLTNEEFEQLCEEQPPLKEMTKNANTEVSLIKKELPDGKSVKVDVIRACREKLNKQIPPISEQQRKIDVFQNFCEEKKINDIFEKFSDNNVALQYIKDEFPEQIDVSLETVTAYMVIAKKHRIELLQKFCKKNELEDKIKNTSNDNEAWELIKTLLGGNDFSLETVTAYRVNLNNPPLKEEGKESDKKSLEEDATKKISDSDDETFSVKTEAEKKATFVGQNQVKEIDELNKLNKELTVENTNLKNHNELLKQKLNISNDKRGIKDDFLSQVPSLNEILNSDKDKASIYINKELLVKATKYVDTHSLIRLENVIRNGYDLNSTIVQSILLEFILQNSLL